MAKHKIELNIVIEWDESEYPYMKEAIMNDWHSPGKLTPDTQEILWGLHGGGFEKTCTAFEVKHTTE